MFYNLQKEDYYDREGTSKAGMEFVRSECAIKTKCQVDGEQNMNSSFI